MKGETHALKTVPRWEGGKQWAYRMLSSAQWYAEERMWAAQLGPTVGD